MLFSLASFAQSVLGVVFVNGSDLDTRVHPFKFCLAREPGLLFSRCLKFGDAQAWLRTRLKRDDVEVASISYSETSWQLSYRLVDSVETITNLPASVKSENCGEHKHNR